MTSDERIDSIVRSTAKLASQLTELKTLQARLREAQMVTMQQTLASGSCDFEEVEVAKYH